MVGCGASGLSSCALGQVNSRRDAMLRASGGSDNSHQLCVRTVVGCGHAFGAIRGMSKVFLCGRSRCGNGTPRSLVRSLPRHGRKFTNHIACTCSCHCVTRLGFKCGNDRGFTGKGHFNFFPSITMKCGVDHRGFFRGFSSIIDGLGLHTS